MYELPIELKSFLVPETLSHFFLVITSVIVPITKLSKYIARYGRQDKIPF